MVFLVWEQDHLLLPADDENCISRIRSVIDGELSLINILLNEWTNLLCFLRISLEFLRVE